MEIKDLVFFQHVVKANSISKAAEELFISQSQVSRVISSLEHELGVELFERKGHKLELTPCGKIFYEESSSIIGLCSKAIDRVKKTYAGMRSQSRSHPTLRGERNISCLRSPNRSIATKFICAPRPLGNRTLFEKRRFLLRHYRSRCKGFGISHGGSRRRRIDALRLRGTLDQQIG